jgi:hypothetical protein
MELEDAERALRSVISLKDEGIVANSIALGRADRTPRDA